MTARPARIPCSGVTLAADVYGDDDHPPVVLLHGGGQTRHSWGTTAGSLSAHGWRVVNIDLRGHGESEWSPDGRYALDDFVSDLDGVVRWLGRRPAFVGASLGGMTSLGFLGRYPDAALALVLVDVSPFLQQAGADRIGAFMQQAPEGFASLEEAADAIAAYVPHRPRPRNLEGLKKNLRLVDGRWRWHWDPAFIQGPRSEEPRRDSVVDPVRLGAASAYLKVPTLLVRGGRSDVLAVDDARRFLRLVPHAEYCDVAEAHHMVAGDDNAVFDQRIGEFLERRLRHHLELGLDRDPT